MERHDLYGHKKLRIQEKKEISGSVPALGEAGMVR